MGWRGAGGVNEQGKSQATLILCISISFFLLKTNYARLLGSFLETPDYWFNEVTLFLSVSLTPLTPASPSHPPVRLGLSVFPTFQCWCVTVMACHLVGMSSCSPTSSPRFGVKHVLLVSDSAHVHTASTHTCAQSCVSSVCLQMVSVGPHTYPWRRATTSIAILI